MTTGSGILERASFSTVRYSNCWEDADILLAALDIKDSDVCLSVASAGDNSLSLLAHGPRLVVAVDISPAQIACVEIRKACFSHCSHGEMLEFLGFTTEGPGSAQKRLSLFSRLAPRLSGPSRAFWERNHRAVAKGIIHMGRFERYFSIFRERVLPLVHSRATIAVLLSKKTREERTAFYDRRWNTWRWNILFRVFFSRLVMGRLGRDPEFFRYVKGSVAEGILARSRHAMTALSTHDNPYLHYIVTGAFGSAVPHYARAENFEAIRRNIDKLELFRGTTQEACTRYGRVFGVFNCSDIFEYMSPPLFTACAHNLLDHARPGARLAYWNMLVLRSCAETFPARLTADTTLSGELLLQDKAFFYQRFHLDRTAS